MESENTQQTNRKATIEVEVDASDSVSDRHLRRALENIINDCTNRTVEVLEVELDG